MTGKIVFYGIVVVIAVVLDVLLIFWQRKLDRHGIGIVSAKDRLRRGIEALRKPKVKTKSPPRTLASIREFTQTLWKEKITGRDRPKLQIVFLM